MTARDFNEKYLMYVEDRHYGLDIHIPEAIEYLDKVFEGLVKIEGFKYSQIKAKFDSTRFYSNLPEILPQIGRGIEQSIVSELNFYLKAEDLIYKRKNSENERI
jgi:hypothetical protein